MLCHHDHWWTYPISFTILSLLVWVRCLQSSNLSGVTGSSQHWHTSVSLGRRPYEKLVWVSCEGRFPLRVGSEIGVGALPQLSTLRLRWSCVYTSSRWLTTFAGARLIRSRPLTLSPTSYAPKALVLTSDVATWRWLPRPLERPPPSCQRAYSTFRACPFDMIGWLKVGLIIGPQDTHVLRSRPSSIFRSSSVTPFVPSLT